MGKRENTKCEGLDMDESLKVRGSSRERVQLIGGGGGGLLRSVNNQAHEGVLENGHE